MITFGTSKTGGVEYDIGEDRNAVPRSKRREGRSSAKIGMPDHPAQKSSAYATIQIVNKNLHDDSIETVRHGELIFSILRMIKIL